MGMCGKRNGTRGFSLVELAIVMAISGLLLTGLLRLYALEADKERMRATRERLQELRTALNVYAATHGRLPCPASPSGKSADDCAPGAAPPPGVAVFTPPKAGPETAVWTGAIPAEALGIPVAETVDGWRNKFTYAVAVKLAAPEALNVHPPPHGHIAVIDAKGENLLDAPETGRYVIISHGRGGRGAWTQGGNRIPCDRRALDGLNCDGDNVFVLADYAPGQGPGHYDDLVIHDQLDTGGYMLGRLATCNARQAFYAPDDPAADAEGCAASKNVWQGACLHTYTGGENGAPEGSPHSRVVLPPPLLAQENPLACGCPKGLVARKIWAWDDFSAGTDPVDTGCPLKAVTQTGALQTPNSVPGKGLWFSDGAGKDILCRYEPGEPPSERTALYTCTRP